MVRVTVATLSEIVPNATSYFDFWPKTAYRLSLPVM